MSDEQPSEIEQARTEIGRAIEKFYDVLFPGQVLTDWVVVAQRNSIDLERDGKRATGTVAATGQTAVVTRGLLELGIDLEKSTQR